MGRLTTHVLDLSRGRPAMGVRVQLHRIEGDERWLVAEALTNADGRCDEPIVEDDAFAAGVYELTFHAGVYFNALGLDLPEPGFLDRIPVRFGISDASKHYHVPLLLSPYGYSTYRGS
jgi:5-hydroxyisourate hydrolase